MVNNLFIWIVFHNISHFKLSQILMGVCVCVCAFFNVVLFFKGKLQLWSALLKSMVSVPIPQAGFPDHRRQAEKS